MELIVTKEAQNWLESHREEDEQILLDLENGDGPFADSRITCQLDTAFRLILIKKQSTADLSLYSILVDTPLGPIRIKKSAEMYLDDPTTLALEPTYQSLQLKGPSGLLKGNLPVVRKD
ncbi:iron-sulfur cluster biosynthesis family protein [Candidatus Enterococcus courvalinii]|uniref:Iron-sulfur cluster biosynthesis family protein n=1 Tax=Candidatus Enterococcus courvalinii TaxID=2815329 RepID=A0ABS3I1B0_9ENTE|nr:iron-sulfur cluster biosynthesis family protein [Enterococcus sp. MSG2901]MBO0482115.1 iron-sulfur cluster biosynthesis family protein [Enterococcus sp. MSG2901]